MARRFTVAVLLMACVLPIASFADAAEDVLKLVPESASGLVIINHPSDLDAKLLSLGSETGLPIPPLLAMLKQRSHIQDGVDEKGTIALIVLPPEAGSRAPTPILLVPVTDYARFLKQLNPEDASEEVAKVELFNHVPSLVRNIGGYAALTEQPNRDVLETKLKLSDTIPATLAAWRPWLDAQDVAGIILQPGIQRGAVMGQKAIREMKASMERMAKMTKNGDSEKIAAVFDMYEQVLQKAEKEVSAFGVGLNIDKQNVVRVASRASLVSGGAWAQFVAQVPRAKENLLAGLPDGPFAVAVGGAFSDALSEELTRCSLGMMKTMRGMYGLSDEQIDKLSEMSNAKLQGVRSFSVALGPGKSGDSLYSTLAVVMRVDNSREYLENYKRNLDAYNEVIKEAKSPFLPMVETEKGDVDGDPAVQLTVTMPQLPEDQQPPQYAQMMETMVGPGGKMASWLVPVDEHRIAIGCVTKEHLQKMIEIIKQGKPGLESNADVAKTAALLPAGAPAVVYVSPAGILELVKRMAFAMAPPEAMVNVKIPEFPATPPIGFAVTTGADEVQTCLVIPAEVLQAIVPYIAKIRSQGNP